MTTPPKASPALSTAEPIPKQVKGLGAVSLLNDLASEMVYPLLPAFLTRTLGASATLLGLLDGAADLASALFKYLSGRLADRPGLKRPLILGGYLAAVLVRPLMALATAGWQVVGLRIADRVGKGIRTPARDALIVSLTSPVHRGRAFGFHRAADHFGAVLGALLGAALLAAGADVRQVLGWSLVPGLVVVGILVLLLRGPAIRQADAQPEPAAVPGANGPTRLAGFPMILLAALTLCRIPEALLLLRLQDLGVPLLAVPLAWAGLHLVRTASSYPGGWLADRSGPRPMIIAGGGVAAVIILLLSRDLAPAAALAVFLGFGVAAGLLEPSERLLVSRLAPGRTGRAFGAYHAMTGIAALPAGLLFGALYEHAGGSTAFLVSAALLGVTLGGWGWVRLEPPAHQPG